MATRSEVVAAAREWIGVPYMHQGRNRFGVDCVGLLIVVARGLGLTSYDVTGYSRVPHAEFLRTECDRMMGRIPIDERQPGDVVLMRFKREPQHLAFVTDRGFLHAYGGSGRVVESAMPPEWVRRIVAAYALPGVH
jgi:NlpC/P60 family putative phage cell wall peptidase